MGRDRNKLNQAGVRRNGEREYWEKKLEWWAIRQARWKLNAIETSWNFGGDPSEDSEQ